MASPNATPKYYDNDPHRLSMVRRLIELPLVIRGQKRSQSYLAELFEVDGVTVRRDIIVLSEYWPIERIKSGREVEYYLAPDAEPKLKKIGKRKSSKKGGDPK